MQTSNFSNLHKTLNTIFQKKTVTFASILGIRGKAGYTDLAPRKKNSNQWRSRVTLISTGENNRAAILRRFAWGSPHIGARKCTSGLRNFRTDERRRAHILCNYFQRNRSRVQSFCTCTWYGWRSVKALCRSISSQRNIPAADLFAPRALRLSPKGQIFLPRMALIEIRRYEINFEWKATIANVERDDGEKRCIWSSCGGRQGKTI